MITRLLDDGPNAFFFKRVWHIIKDDVIADTQVFFYSTCLFKPINCINLTLIPNVNSPNLVSQYKPIACCNIIYKMVFKVLTRRLQDGISTVVDPTQAGFIPGRQFIENVLLTIELVNIFNFILKKL